MQRISSILISMVIVVLALLAGYLLADLTHSLIRAFLPLPKVDLAFNDARLTGEYLTGASLIVFTVMALAFPAKLLGSANRTAIQVYGWGAAWGIGSLSLFLTSSSVFPHRLLVGAFIVGIVLFCAAYAVFGPNIAEHGEVTALDRLKAVIAALFKLLLKPLNLFNIQDGTLGLKNEGLRDLPALLEFGPIGVVAWDDKRGWSLV